MKRKIIEIDQDKCNGCGHCVSACHEGAIQLIDGKARLMSDAYCDGLGACIGKCPVDAIKIIEREAEAFSEEAVNAKKANESKIKPQPHVCGCPGSAMKTFLKRHNGNRISSDAEEAISELTHWPIQLRLVPVNAPFWNEASLLIAADCSAFSMGSFHSKLLKDKKLIIACPKLDDTGSYAEKLSSIIAENNIRDVSVVYMEVPCCRGLVSIVEEGLSLSGKNIPLKLIKLGLNGEIIS